MNVFAGMASADDGLASSALLDVGFDMWQGHPVLNNLFDISQNHAATPVSTGFGDRVDSTAWFDPS